MSAKNTVRTIVAAIMVVSLGLSGPLLAGERQHAGNGHSYGGGHGYNQNRGHGGYGGGHGYSYNRGHGGYGYGYGYSHNRGHGGYSTSYSRNNHGDLLFGLLLGGVTGYALSNGQRYH